MASKAKMSEDERRSEIHRRVQTRIAGMCLDEVDPDRTLVKELYKDRYQEFKEMDPVVKKKFDSQYKKFKHVESAYSIQNVLWLIASIAVFYYTNFYIAVRFDPRVNRLWFNIGAVLITITVVIALFLILYLSHIKKVQSDDWEKLYPAAIPTATACSVLGGLFVLVGLWPVWGPLTPVILFALFMGFVVMVAMLPSWI